MLASRPSAARIIPRLEPIITPVACYVLTTLVVVLGVAFGREFVRASPLSHGDLGPFVDSFALWDGGWYARIVSEGYRFDPGAPSSPAFFPAYPMLARLVGRLTGWDAPRALVACSHASFVAAVVSFYAYARRRMSDSSEAAQLALAALCLVPTTFFFRMAYAESLLLLIAVLVLFGIHQGWSPLVLSLIVGLGTATRPSGAALLLPFALFLGRGAAADVRSVARFAWLAVAGWGLIAYVVFQAVAFGDPIAFAHAQAQWHARTNVALSEKLFALVTLGAIRGVYSKASPFYWGHYVAIASPAFSLYFANSIYFGATVLAIVVGAAKRWLDRYEVALALGLVGIPYVMHNYETTMMATGRYMTTVVPTYLVIGRVLARLPLGPVVAIMSVAAFMLGAYAALFALGYWMI